MRWTIPYGFLYRTGRTPWDTGVTPPEVVELVEGKTPLPPGRALDLGCGTGNEVAYLARHGWTATGVDLVQVAIDRAASKIEGLPNAAVRRGDVTKLGEMGLDGPFDLVLDLGCFHSLSSDGRDAYAAGVGSLTATGAVLFMFAFATRLPWSLVGTGVTPGEMRDRFAPWFDPVGRIRGRRPRGATWYRLRRR
jgi:cyclopropane fatty-acyl-phospholipid synthase-like methyltransferase